MYIGGLIPRKSEDLSEVIPIGYASWYLPWAVFFSTLQISVSVSLADGFQVGMLVVKCPDRRSIKTLPLNLKFQIEVEELSIL